MLEHIFSIITFKGRNNNWEFFKIVFHMKSIKVTNPWAHHGKESKDPYMQRGS